MLPFITKYTPAVPNLKEILTRKWYLIQQQPLLNLIFKEPPIISYRKGDSLKDIHITKARKPSHVFPSRVRLSTHVNTLLIAEPFNCVVESSSLGKVLEMRQLTLRYSLNHQPWLLCLRLVTRYTFRLVPHLSQPQSRCTNLDVYVQMGILMSVRELRYNMWLSIRVRGSSSIYIRLYVLASGSWYVP